MENRGFWGGFALTAPFAVNPLPSWAAMMFALPLAIHVARFGLKIPNLWKLGTITSIVVATVLLHLAFVSTSDYPSAVMSNLYWTGIVLAITATFANTICLPERAALGLFWGLGIFASAIGLIGAAKYFFHVRGFLFEPILSLCDGQYQAGSILCGDYNVAASAMLVAGIGLSVLLLRDAKRAPLIGLMLAVVMACGFFLGSRRFLFLAPLVPATLLAGAVYLHSWGPLRRIVVPTVVFCLLLVTLSQEVPHLNGDEMKKVGLGLTGLTFSSSHDGNQMNYVLARVSPDVVASTVGPEAMSSRMERWAEAMRLVAKNNYVLGQGFTYQRHFSCAFVACAHIDYPHSPILSSWVGFGLVGLILVLGFYGIIAINMAANRWTGLINGTTAIAACTAIYSLISGDTIFSVHHILVAGILVCLPQLSIQGDSSAAAGLRDTRSRDQSQSHCTTVRYHDGV